MQEQNLQLQEIPSQKKIIEKRRLPGQLKVFASWYLIWNTIHQIVLDLFLAIVICNTFAVCTNDNLPLLRSGRLLLAACTSIVHINMRMNDKARKRWKAKYIDVQSKVSPALQSLSSNDTQVKDAGPQVKQRPYLKCHIDELQRITASGWNNTKILNEIHYELEFRSRKKALDLRERIAARLTQLQSATTANPGSQNLPSDAFKYEEGLLRHYGYKVGMNGLPESERWEILDTVFLRPLLQMDNTVYLSEWGEPHSAKRLQKLADSIAAFTRNAKGQKQRNFSKAIQDWETDLAYLKRTYYNSRFSFQYPRT